MTLGKNFGLVSIAMGLVLGSACSPKSATTKEDSTTDTDDNGSNKVGSASNVADLKLAGSLNIDLPEAFGGSESGSALRLLEAKKSQEACMMGSVIKRSVRRLSEVGGFFCHLEVEKDRVVFGKKYKLVTSRGEFARLWVDNSDSSSGKIRLGFCSTHQGDGQQESSKQLITIDSLSDAGPKGSIITTGEGNYNGTAFTYGSSNTFDMSVAGIVSLLAKEGHSQSDNTFVREVQLELKNEGVNTLKLSNKGSGSFGEFFDRGVALVSAEKGSIILQSKGTSGMFTFDFARRAHFSRSGDVLTAADVGAELQPAIADVPSYLPSDFAPDALTGWVGEGCPDFEEEVTLDPESAGHTACGQGRDDNEMDCWDQTKYEAGSESVTFE